MAVKKVAVVGAGRVSLGIAAHLANAGLEVELLNDVPEEGAADKNIVSKSIIARIIEEKLLTLMRASNVQKFHAGNTEENMDRLQECDFIIECMAGELDEKVKLLKQIDENRKEGSIVASSSASFLLADLMEDQSEALKKDFFITHFFKHPRYIRLLELVTSDDNSEDQITEVEDFLDKTLGKRVIRCNDTPELLGNRLGLFWLQCAINEAYNFDMQIEEVDALLSKPLGIPKTGIFSFIDLLGLDFVFNRSKDLLEKLSKVDAYHRVYKSHPQIEKMMEAGFAGLKSKGGFYRKNENQKHLSFDLHTGEIRIKEKPDLDAIKNSNEDGIKALISTPDKYGEYTWNVLKQFLTYVAEHANNITEDITLVDEVMRLGYGWKYGPFELLDKIGVDYFINRIKRENGFIPEFIQKAEGRTFYRVKENTVQFLNSLGDYKDIKRPEGVLLLSDIKLKAKNPVIKNSWLANKLNMGANVWDIGDGVLCIEFCSRMNSIDFFNLKIISDTCRLAERSNGLYKAVVIYNEGSDFSVGANIRFILNVVSFNQYWIIKKLLQYGQKVLLGMKYSKIPVVSAPAGRATGSGCEILMHSHHVQAYAETYTGLMEINVGLLPCWGGTSELLTRMVEAQKQGRLPGGPVPPLVTAFENISTAKVSTSAFEAKDFLYLNEKAGVTMNKYRLLADAKERALEMAKDFTPQEPVEVDLVGMSGLAALRIIADIIYLRGLISPYDVIVFDKIAEALTGGRHAENRGAFSEKELRELELENTMFLLRQEQTVARMDHILRKGRPLREPHIKDKTAIEIRAEAYSF